MELSKDSLHGEESYTFDEESGNSSDESDDDGDDSDETEDDGEESEGESEENGEGNGESEDNEDFGDRTEQRTDYVSDGDPERENCPICLNRFLGQRLGVPENCDHIFCFECIYEWSKNINTCPIDRTEFQHIRKRATPDGEDIKNVKVKVLPKEAEETLEENPTLCEVCHSADREDRLLLCDGCDLAYHCECLDPPLFYIPIEEWFCPPCTGVFQNRAVAGPSHRARRVIPRTRASETVRSRVQNRRNLVATIPRSTFGRSRSTSNQSRAGTSRTTRSPRKRKRRTYRRTYKKVVKLARTQKNVSDAGKGKLAATGTTVVLTYRRRRRRRRARRAGVKKSSASVNTRSAPSSKQRIARHLGISKPPAGISLPQMKPASGSRTSSRVTKMPTHSLFGNKNQLMDFSENFSEELSNGPSTSVKRSLKEDSSPVASCVNILDSILAGQKMLHARSDNIVIKTDGSLVLKESNIASKKITMQKPATSDSSRTPMSVALAKKGVAVSDSSAKKKSSLFCTSSRVEKTQTKQNVSSTSPKTSYKKTVTSKSNISAVESTVANAKYANKGGKAGSISSWKIPKKVQNKPKSDEEFPADDGSNLFDDFGCDIPSDSESELSDTASTSNRNKSSNVYSRRKKDAKSCSAKEDLNSADICEKNDSRGQDLFSETFSNISIKKEVVSDEESENKSLGRSVNEASIKKEILSDDETNMDFCSLSVEGDNNTGNKTSTFEAVFVKQEILSDEETNIDCCIESTKLQKTDDVKVNNIKNENKDSDSDEGLNDTLAYELSFAQNTNRSLSHDLFSAENENSGCDMSQSIIHSHNLNNNSKDDKVSNHTLQIKIKEEMPSDTEDYSQSLVESNGLNNEAVAKCSSIIGNKYDKPFNDNHISSGSHRKSISKSSTALDNNKIYGSSAERKYPKVKSENICEDFESSSSNLYDENLPSTQLASCSTGRDKVQNSSVKFPEKNLPSKAIPPLPNVKDRLVSNCGANLISEDLPCTQISSFSCVKDTSNLSTNSSQGFSPPTQRVEGAKVASVSSNLLSVNNLPCIQAISFDIRDSNSLDNLPPTQVTVSSRENNNILNLAANLSCDDELPCTQVTYVSGEGCETAPKSSNNQSLLSMQKVPLSDFGNKTSNTSKELINTQPTENSNWSKSLAHSDKHSSNMLNSSKERNGNSLIFTESFDELPATQVSSSSIVPNHNSALNEQSVNENNNCFKKPLNYFPASKKFQNGNDQPIKKTSKKESENVINTASSDDLPATQLSETSDKRKSRGLSFFDVKNKKAAKLSEDDLPSTQVASSYGKNNKNTSDVVEHQNTVHGSCSIVVDNSTDNQTVDNDFDSLPATQMFDSKVTEPLCIENVPNSNDQGQKEPYENINDIISNIKKIVHSCLSTGDHDNNIIAPVPESSLDNNSTENINSEGLKLGAAATDLESTEGVKTNANQTSDKLQNISDVGNHLISENLKEAVEIPSIRVNAIKKSGIHKHLPQVITAIPVKENIKPKLPNRKTFSFDEVAKLEKPPVLEPDSNNLSVNADKYVKENNATKYDFDVGADVTRKVDQEIFGNEAEKRKLNVNSAVKENACILQNVNNKSLHEKFISVAHQSNDEEDDFPATQIAALERKDLSNLSGIQVNKNDMFISNASSIPSNECKNEINTDTSGNKSCSTIISTHNIDNVIFLSDGDDSNLPSTQHHDVNKESVNYVELPCTQLFSDNSNSSSICELSDSNNRKDIDSKSSVLAKSLKQSISSSNTGKRKEIPLEVSKMNKCNDSSKSKTEKKINQQRENNDYNINKRKSRLSETNKEIEKISSKHPSSKKLKSDDNHIGRKEKSRSKLNSNVTSDAKRIPNANKKEKIQVITKQENIDTSEILLDSKHNLKISSFTGINLSDIKSEHIDDFSLPPTQAFALNDTIPISKNIDKIKSESTFLTASTNIKQEILSDDEISIIEVSPKVKVEILSVEDDNNVADTIPQSHGENSLNCDMRHNKSINTDIKRAEIKHSHRKHTTHEKDRTKSKPEKRCLESEKEKPSNTSDSSVLTVKHKKKKHKSDLSESKVDGNNRKCISKSTDSGKSSKSSKCTKVSETLNSSHTHSSSSEKENDSSDVKPHYKGIITLKPSKKRSHEHDEHKLPSKRLKQDASCSDKKIDHEINKDLNKLKTVPGIKQKNYNFEDENLKNSNIDEWPQKPHEEPVKHFPKISISQAKLSVKQDLKEEIANEVKQVLKPFYSTSLISKEDYKDIMRKAVPKIFLNCHNTINPEKIRKLVLSYISLLNKS